MDPRETKQIVQLFNQIHNSKFNDICTIAQFLHKARKLQQVTYSRNGCGFTIFHSILINQFYSKIAICLRAKDPFWVISPIF